MTRVDFHSNVTDKIAYTCRLVRKAHAANCKLVLLTADETELARLDEALWTFSDVDFLPHVDVHDPLAPSTPIILASAEVDEFPHHQILINLSGKTPAHFARFERMFEIISAEEADKAKGRDRYRFYQQRGYPLTHFVAGQA